jgi:hypothetical protein
MQNGDVLEAMNLNIYWAHDINVTFLVQRFVSERKPILSPEPIESSIRGFFPILCLESRRHIATSLSDAELTLPIAARSRPEPTYLCRHRIHLLNYI